MDSMVDSSRVEQGGVSLGLTLGDVGHNGGGLEAGEDLAQDRSGQRSVVDQRSLDSGVGDQGSMETRGVDNGSLDRSIVDHRSLYSRFVDNRGLERSIVDQGRVESRVDSRQSVGVDQGWVSLSFRLSFSLPLAVVVDQRSLDSGVVDQGSLETSGVDNGSLDRSIVDHRSLL